MPSFGSLFFHRRQRRTSDDRNVVARELVHRQQLAQLQLHQVQQLRVVHHVHFVHVHHDGRHVHLTRQQNVLARLRHRAVVRRHHQDSAVHLRRARDHVLDVVRVPRAIHVRVVPRLRLVFHVGDRDGDPALFLFRRLVNRVEFHHLRLAQFRKHLGDTTRQRGLPVVHVTNRPNVHVRLCPLEFFLRHRS